MRKIANVMRFVILATLTAGCIICTSGLSADPISIDLLVRGSIYNAISFLVAIMYNCIDFADEYPNIKKDRLTGIRTTQKQKYTNKHDITYNPDCQDVFSAKKKR